MKLKFLFIAITALISYTSTVTAQQIQQPAEQWPLAGSRVTSSRYDYMPYVRPKNTQYDLNRWNGWPGIILDEKTVDPIPFEKADIHNEQHAVLVLTISPIIGDEEEGGIINPQPNEYLSGTCMKGGTPIPKLIRISTPASNWVGTYEAQGQYDIVRDADGKKRRIFWEPFLVHIARQWSWRGGVKVWSDWYIVYQSL